MPGDIHFEKYRDTDGKWRWRFRAANGEITATSGGDGYSSEQDCNRGILLLQTKAYDARVETV